MQPSWASVERDIWVCLVRFPSLIVISSNKSNFLSTLMAAHEFHDFFLFPHSCSLINGEYNGIRMNFQINILQFGYFDAF